MLDKLKNFFKKNFDKSDIIFSLSVIVVLVLLNTFIIQPMHVISGSMESTIMTGDFCLGLRCAYFGKDPERFDIISFEFDLEGCEYVKRVIGLPGEKVEIREGKIYINDGETPLEENYLKEKWIDANDGYVFYVPEGYYFVLGDNRNHSLDSRYWQGLAYSSGLTESYDDAAIYSYVPREKVSSKIVFRTWPPFKRIS